MTPNDALPGAPTALTVPIGPRLLELLGIAYRARRPVLLEGPTGIGKSQIVAELTQAMGLDLVVLDLSLLEPPDLVGLPVIADGRTHYASPAVLPHGGRGVLLLEELNRAELPVMQPALQLLSARRLHAYVLPPGWTCVAAVNPEGGDYQVNPLDPALRSRFLQLSVCADRDTWLPWAARTNVHPVVMRVVQAHPDAFAHASPRSWAYASDVLHAMRASELADRDLVRAVLRGYLPTAWALVVTAAVAGMPATLDIGPEVLFSSGGAATLTRAVQALERESRGDAVAVLAAKVRRIFADLPAGATDMQALEGLVAAFPGDVREQCLQTAAESPASAALLSSLGHDPAAIARYAGSRLQADVRSWRREGRVARVRLAVVAASRALAVAAEADLPALAAAIAPLVVDSGPVGADLGRWLDARAPRSGA